MFIGDFIVVVLDSRRRSIYSATDEKKKVEKREETSEVCFVKGVSFV